MKKLIKSILPESIYLFLNKIRLFVINFRYKSKNNTEIFSEIYNKKLWNKKSNRLFDSGTGSHEKSIVEKYSEAINSFISEQKYVVVDLGCGDFNIAEQYYKNCKKYYGIDVVPDLISELNKRYNNDNAEFLNLDAALDDLPDGDVILIKEVLQHLTNSDIQKIALKLNKYKYTIVTESFPFNLAKPNLDKIKGPLSRSYRNSAVILHEHPFNLVYRKKTELLKIYRKDIGYLITYLYEKWYFSRLYIYL